MIRSTAIQLEITVNGSFSNRATRTPDPEETFIISMIERQVTERSRRTGR
jgi:hypothetical protein